MLRWRLLLGAVFIGALAGLIVLDYRSPRPGSLLIVLALVLGLAAAHEVLTLLAAGGHHPLATAVYGGTLLVVASNAVPLFWLSTADDKPWAGSAGR